MHAPEHVLLPRCAAWRCGHFTSPDGMLCAVHGLQDMVLVRRLLVTPPVTDDGQQAPIPDDPVLVNRATADRWIANGLAVLDEQPVAEQPDEPDTAPEQPDSALTPEQSRASRSPYWMPGGSV